MFQNYSVLNAQSDLQTYANIVFFFLKWFTSSGSSSSLFYSTTRKTPNKNKEQKQWPKNRLQRQNDIRWNVQELKNEHNLKKMHGHCTLGFNLLYFNKKQTKQFATQRVMT